MAKLIIQCENCGAEREVDEKLAGSTLSCAGCGETIRIPIPDIGEGVNLGGFVLEKLLGFGAMGEVWLAHQQTMDRKVALKLLSREFTLDSQFVDRFLKEVRLSAKMDHPNIITAFDAGCDKDIYYLAISFVDGTDLDQRLAEAQILPEKEALKITREISSALCYAWNDFKILHRDIKPSNIMIDKKGSAKLMDMGISKSINEEAQLTMTGTVIGTPYYMSPEQGMGEKALDCRSDIYSLGATLYHLVTGSLPFEATTAIGIISKHITEPLPPPQNANPNLSDQCTALLEIMMAKGCSDRQQTWEEVIEDIDMVLAGEFPVSKHRPEPGDSIVMRAVTDQDLQAVAPHAKQTVVYEEEQVPVNPMTASQPQVSASQLIGQPVSPEKPKSKAPLIIILSVAAILALVGAAIFVFSGDEPVKTNEGLGLKHDSFPEDLNPEPKPVAQPPVKQTPLPPKNIPDPNVKRYTEMWEFATKYAKNNPTNYDVAISNFEEISRSAGGSKYKMMADVEISKLNKSKESAIKGVMDSLHQKVKPYKDKKDFHRVADIYIQYAGPWDQETLQERQTLCDDYHRQGDEHNNHQQAEENRKRQEMRETVSQIVMDMIQGNMKDASAKLQIASKKVILPGDIRQPLEELLNISKRVQDSFNNDLGKQITLKTTQGPIEVTIKKIKGGSVYIEEKKGKVVTQKRFSLSRLSEDEIIHRSAMGPDAVAMYKALKAAKLKNMDEAKRSAENLHGQLKEIFGETMGRHYMPEDFADKPEKHQEPMDNNRHDNQIVKKNEHREPQDFRDDNDPFSPQNRSKEPMRRDGEYNKAFGKLHRQLKDVNPDYNGRGRFFGTEGKKIEEVDMINCPETDNEMLKVLAKLPDLKVLDIAQSRVTDLSPLENTKLEMLNLTRCNDLNNLSPLTKIKTLRALSIMDTRIPDINALKDMDLEMLDISNSKVRDISVLKGKPIKNLRMMGCMINDFSVLKTMKKLEFLEPMHLWKFVPGKEHLANRRMPMNRKPMNDPDNMRNEPKNNNFQDNRW